MLSLSAAWMTMSFLALKLECMKFLGAYGWPEKCLYELTTVWKLYTKYSFRHQGLDTKINLRLTVHDNDYHQEILIDGIF